jgi:hypothetical protein
MDRGTVRNMYRFYSKNKFEKLERLVGFVIRIYHDVQSVGCQKLAASYFICNKVTPTPQSQRRPRALKEPNYV